MKSRSLTDATEAATTESVEGAKEDCAGSCQQRGAPGDANEAKSGWPGGGLSAAEAPPCRLTVS